MFELSIDAARALLRITLEGYWPDAEMTRFEEALPAALIALARLPGPSLCLVDASTFPVQGRDIADRHGRRLAAVEPMMADHIATVLPSTLGRAQARRVFDARRHFFGDVDEALAWLTARAAGARAAA